VCFLRKKEPTKLTILVFLEEKQIDDEELLVCLLKGEAANPGVVISKKPRRGKGKEFLNSAIQR